MAGDSVVKAGKEMNFNRLDENSVRIAVYSQNKNIIADGEAIKLKIVPLTNKPNFKMWTICTYPRAC